MAKGLPRSLGRNKAALQVKRVPLNHSVTVSATGAAVGFGSVPVIDLPEGNVYVLASVAYVQLATTDTDISADFDGDFALGLAATADADLDDENEGLFISSTALGAATSKTSPRVRAVGTSGEIVDNTAGDLQAHLNVLIDAAKIVDGGSAVFTVTGSVYIVYVVMGDD